MHRLVSVRLGAAVLGLGLCAAAAAAALEERITSAPLADIEFDSARDGQWCPSCNFGDGNSRVVFTGADGTLWVAQVDWATGRFIPENGRGTLLDNNAAYYRDFGNGPSWSYSLRGSELVYTRYLDGLPPSPETAGLGWARMTGPGQWAAGPVAGGLGRVAPKGTQDRDAPVARISYGGVSRSEAWWRIGDFSAPEVRLPGADSNRGLGLRWVGGTDQILFTDTPDGPVKQVYLHDTVTGATEQITSGRGNKRAQFMFFPPEFGGEAIFFVVVDDTRFDFYRRLPDAQGQLRWTLFQSLATPADRPYIAGSPEAFVHNGKSWIVLSLAESDKPAALSDIALMGIGPGTPELRRLTDASSPARWRSDPEYFVNHSGVYIYFTRARLVRNIAVHEGIWRVDTGLGPRLP
jgi:hypothetical protein